MALSLDGRGVELDRATVARLRDRLAEAAAGRESFLHTACEHRPDGRYVVERRAATAAGHRKVFDGFTELWSLYETLPREFTAADVGRDGLTGGRRHLLVRHLAEHPAFDCELVSKQPLTVRKRGEETDSPD